jgi:Cu+-exporting ATPase
MTSSHHEHSSESASGAGAPASEAQPPPAHTPNTGNTDTASNAPTGPIYTCPMHPQVRQVGPGNCPICGMALEPLLPMGVDDESNVRSARRKFWICAKSDLGELPVCRPVCRVHQHGRL